MADVEKEIICRAAGDPGGSRSRLVLAGALRGYCEARGVSPDLLPGGGLAELVRSRRAEWRRRCIAEAVPAARMASDEFIGRLYLAAAHDRESSARTGVVYTPRATVEAVLSVLDDPPLLGQAAPEGDYRVLDPACGCGAFLLAAFDRLHGALVRHLGVAGAEAAGLVLGRMLAGCDVDAGAVEVTRLLLAVRALAAGCRRVPRMNVSALDFLSASRRMPPAYQVVIGNPPFVEGRRLAKDAMADLKLRFRACGGKVNLAACFVERALESLVPGGSSALVLPGAMLRNERYAALRRLVLEQRVDKVLAVRELPFDGRVVDASVLVVSRARPARAHRTRVAVADTVDGVRAARYRDVSQELFVRSEHYRLNVLHSEGSLRLLARMRERGVRLGEFCETRDGISTGFHPFPSILMGERRGEYFINRRGERQPFTERLHKRVIDGGEISAYGPIRWEGRHILYRKALERHPAPPAGRPFNCQLRDEAIFDRQLKVLTRQTADRLVAALDAERFYCRNSVHVTYAREALADKVALEAVMMLLNSQAVNYYYRMSTQETARAFPQVHISALRSLPVPDGALEPYGELAVLGRLAATDGIEPPELARVIERAEGVISDAFRLPAADRRRICRHAAAAGVPAALALAAG